MSTVVFESNPRSREVLGDLLSSCGLKNVLSTGNSSRFLHLLAEQGSALRLIILSSQPGEEVSVRLSQAIEQRPELAAIPVLFLTDSLFIGNRRRAELSRNTLRVDQFLERPFGPEKLKLAIDEASRVRARSRDVILNLSVEPNFTLNETLFEFDANFHWREIITVSSPKQLTEQMQKFSWRVGAVFVDPNWRSTNARSVVQELRRTTLGARTLFALMGKSPEETHDYRDICEFFFARSTREEVWSESDCLSLLERTSQRLIQNEPVRGAVQRARELLREKNLKSARGTLQKALKLDSERVEVLELLGRIEEQANSPRLARQYFEKAIAVNPCAPLGYLRLLSGLTEGTQRKALLIQSEKYCPKHPQLREQFKAVREAFG
jgi:CheY-like chemotaxis protein